LAIFRDEGDPDGEWIGLDQLDRQLGMDVEKRAKGYLSAILPGQDAVRLYRLEDRRSAGDEPFEAVRSRVEFDFWLYSKRQFQEDLRRQRVQGGQSAESIPSYSFQP
jgi:parvulin-like peptidyl-prolyl isomerase